MGTRDKVRVIIEGIDEKILFLSSEFDGALVGTAKACGGSDVAAYDLTRCMEIMINNHNIDEMEALEQVQQSIDKASFGTYKPIFINDFRNIKDIHESFDPIKDGGKTLKDLIEEKEV